MKEDAKTDIDTVSFKDALDRAKKLIKEGKVKEALNTPLFPASAATDSKKKKIEAFFERMDDGKTEVSVYSGICIGDVLYDRFSIDPEALKAADFLYKDKIGNFFEFSEFVKKKFPVVDTGSGAFIQLRGYVAEQELAASLKAKGYEVAFPDNPNQAGYDILLDGQEFQVKCTENTSILLEHFEKNPDIPVYANIELAEKVESLPEDIVDKIYFDEALSLEKIEDITKESIESGVDIFDFDFELSIGIIGLASARNIYKLVKGRKTPANAFASIIAEAGAGLGGKAAGAVVGKVAGTLLFGPAGGYVFGGLLSVVGATQGRKIINAASSLWAKKEYQTVLKHLDDLLDASINGLKNRRSLFQTRRDKIMGILQEGQIAEEFSIFFEEKLDEDETYIKESINELEHVKKDLKKFSSDIKTVTKNVLNSILRSQVHPFFIQDTLIATMKAIEDWERKKINPI